MSAATRMHALPLALVALTLVALAPAACTTTSATPKGTLDRSQVETVRVEGRLYEVRVAPAEVEGEYRLLIVRGPTAVQRLFALSAVDEAFEMVSDVPEALTSR